jgi:hypothetical protein
MSDPNTDHSLEINTMIEVQEVRYSLPQLLKELEIERTSSVFSKEILDQTEISKIFDQKKRARGQNREH